MCYVDGPQLPPLNFSSLCTEYGRYVIFYNERLNGDVYPAEYESCLIYTELCEVIVHGKSIRKYCLSMSIITVILLFPHLC